MVTCTSVSLSKAEKLMRPLCLGPLTDFQPRAWLGMFCTSSASHSNRLPYKDITQWERRSKSSTRRTSEVMFGRLLRSDQAVNTSWTGRPICRLSSILMMRLLRAEASACQESIKPIPVVAPLTAPTAKPFQKLFLFMIHLVNFPAADAGSLDGEKANTHMLKGRNPFSWN